MSDDQITSTSHVSAHVPVATISPRAQSIFLFVLNTVIIVLTVWWTSSVTHVTIYDKFLVRLEGVSIPVTHLSEATQFYTSVLNFVPTTAGRERTIEETRERSAFLLPDKRKLFLQQTVGDKGGDKSTSAPAAPMLVLRVRNGFERLQKELAERVASYNRPSDHRSSDNGAAVPTLATISGIRSYAWGEEFVVTDADGNTLVFLKPRRHSTTRL